MSDWHGRIGIIFQDFNRYELSAADNIGFGSIAHLDDRAAIREAARQADVLEAIERLPRGLETPLWFAPKGVEDEAEIKWRKDFLRKIGYKQ